ncbi:MAG: DUF5054 domain-containing protein [Oscillospiraceae bacterium]|nr:DUF5054 domain-containing protein [Oscillospiraceae bacterium]
MKKEILLVFKTHLDIGYTDYAKNVVRNYLDVFIPNAIKVGYKLKDTKTPFVWTVGSWIIWKALKEDASGTVEQAIRDGIITWHALPFTTHTELMNKELFEYSLGISKELDERFCRRTIGSKMTDVPGHTRGMIPLMKKAGVEFLHIGVNPATPNPDVPAVFRWRCGKDEIIVAYEDSYGEYSDYGDFAVYFAHTNDNIGPQSEQDVLNVYKTLSEKYPDCTVHAATLNDVAERIMKMPNLPVVDREIGDTWIHGAGTDPKKVGMYRELLRHIETQGVNDADLRENLLLAPEHTWGLCLQKYFDNKNDWFHDELESTIDTERKKHFEASWEEQRSYIKEAGKALGVNVDYILSEPNPAGFEKCEHTPDIEISWQLFDRNDYERYKEKYLTLTPENTEWALWDDTKPGLPDYRGGIYPADVKESYKKGDTYLYKLEFEKELSEKYGLPHFWLWENDGDISVEWFRKKANRLPQAFWLKFKGFRECWEIEKLGQWISPDEIIGSPLITAVGKGVRNGEAEIIPIDSCIVAPFGRRLLDFEKRPHGQDMYFNLYNNIWNTNFPMWY